MSKHLDPIKAKISQALKDAHSPSTIKEIKATIKTSGKDIEFTEFGKDKPSAAVNKLLGTLANRAVMANSDHTTTGSADKLVYGVLLGATSEIINGNQQIYGAVYEPTSRKVHYIQPAYIALEDAVEEAEVFITIANALSDAGWKLAVSDDKLSNPEGFIDCWEAPGSTSTHKIYLNVMQLVQGNLQKKAFFLGVQLKSSTYTKGLLDKLHQVGISTVEQTNIADLKGAWHNVIRSIPIQLSITPLIRLDDFLFKFDLTDITDCGKILRFYAYDMASNNFTGVSVKSITTNTALFTTVADLRDSGLKKETAEDIMPELEEHRVNFEAYKTKLISFLCEYGFEIKQISGGNFVFYDNKLYDALIDHILSPALEIKSKTPQRTSFYQHKIFLGYMGLPPFFIDLNDEVVLPADSYTSYLNTSKGMGKPNSPESSLQTRSQDAWISLEAAMTSIAQNKAEFTPRDIILLLNMALE